MARPRINTATKKLEWIDEEMYKDLEEINRIRYGNKMDKKLQSIRRTTKAVRRHPLWSQIKIDVIGMKFEKEI